MGQALQGSGLVKTFAAQTVLPARRQESFPDGMGNWIPDFSGMTPLVSETTFEEVLGLLGQFRDV
jgi:hypothetical protein